VLDFAAQRIHLLQVLMNTRAKKSAFGCFAPARPSSFRPPRSIYIVDPLQLFRPARLFAAGYSLDGRMQNAGLIRSQQYDTVFMGDVARDFTPAKRHRPDSRGQVGKT